MTEITPTSPEAIDSLANSVLEALTTERSQNPVDAAIQALLGALDLDQRDVAQIDITAAGRIHIFGIDRSARSAKATPLKRYERDAQNRIIK